MSLPTSLGFGGTGFHSDDAVRTRTTLISCVTLANELKTDHNAVLAKLDLDGGVTSTNYASLRTVAAASAGTVNPTLGQGGTFVAGDDGVKTRLILQALRTLANELKVDHNALLTKLDADGLTDTDFADATTTSEQQTVTVTATSGTFALTYAGQTTDPIAEAATAATVQVELEQLSNIEIGDVTVAGAAGGPYTLSFAGNLAGANLAALTSDATLTRQANGTGTAAIATAVVGAAHTPTHATTLTGGAAASVTHATTLAGVTSTPTHATTVPGVAATTNEVQTITLADGPTAGTFTITYSGQTTGAIEAQPAAATVKTALESLSNIAVDDVAVVRAGAGTAGDPYVFTVTFQNALGLQDVPQMTSTPTLLGVNEVQTITLTGGPNTGNFTVTWSGQTTGNIAYNASAATVITALEALSNIGVGDVGVARAGVGSSADPYVYTVTFQNSLGAADQAQATSAEVGLGVNEIQTVTLTGGSTAGNFTLTYSGQTTANNAYNASAATVKTNLEALSNIAVDDVSVARSGAGTAGDPYVYAVTFQNALGDTNVGEMTSASVSLGVNEQQTVTVTAAAGTYTLTYSGQTTAAIAFNALNSAVQSALEALSNIAVGDVLVTGGIGDQTGSAPYTVEFKGALTVTNVAEMTSSAALLQAVGTVVIAESVAGEAPNTIVTTDVGTIPVELGSGAAQLHADAGAALNISVRRLISLLNEVKAKRNTLMAKLDADGTVADADYVALHTTAAANAA